MKLADLGSSGLRRQLRNGGIHLRTGPFVTRLRSSLPSVADHLARLYGGYAVEPPTGFADFHVRLRLPAGPRRWFRPQVLFQFDGRTPFKPLPADQAFPMLEWGLNWCVSNHAHQYLIVHAAVVEKNAHAAILPAPPGSGKSTLCAGLISRGWRLLSDELALISPARLELVPLARPVNLKNDSIAVMRRFNPEAIFSEEFEDTNKGTVALMQAPADSIARQQEPARPRWIILPRYEAGAATRLARRDKSRMFMHMADSGFNYSLLGLQGFETLSRLIDRCDCYEFVYSDLDEAVASFDKLAAEQDSGLFHAP